MLLIVLVAVAYNEMRSTNASGVDMPMVVLISTPFITVVFVVVTVVVMASAALLLVGGVW